METPVLVTILVSAIIFALIFSGKVHRTIVAWGGSIVILLIGKYYGFLNESIKKMKIYFIKSLIGLDDIDNFSPFNILFNSD